MKSGTFAKVIPGIIAALCIFMLAYWFSSNRRAVEVDKRVPGQDKQIETPDQKASPAGTESASSDTAIPSTTTASTQTVQSAPTGTQVPTLPGSWPRFRGTALDNVNTEAIPIATKWANGAPPLLWSLNLGEGHAGAAVFNSRVYLLDYDRDAQADVLRCLMLSDGKEIWRYAYPSAVKRNHGMSRTVPAVTDKYVVTIGPKCIVLCADPMTGKVFWTLDLVKEYKTEIPPWYAGQCPLIDGDRAIIAPGGSSLMIAVDCATGKTVWKTPNPSGWSMTHSSIIPMTFKGQKMYIYCGSGGVAGISAKDGSILWQTTDWTVKIANVPTPVLVGDDRIFLCGGYNAGSMMLKLKSQGNQITPQTLYKLKAEVFGSDQQTPVYYKGYIYGVIPGGQLACLDLTGKQRWTSGTSYKFGIGPYMIADGKIIVMNDSGVMTIAEASPTGFKPLVQAKLLSGHDSWGPMALAGGRLIARDLTQMVCIDIAKH
ncbi:MAG: PQQ-binding-like beta-propeller repeat protein [Armatimonadota bacterium]